MNVQICHNSANMRCTSKRCKGKIKGVVYYNTFACMKVVDRSYDKNHEDGIGEGNSGLPSRRITRVRSYLVFLFVFSY